MPNNPFQLDASPDTFLRRAALTVARPLLAWTLKTEEFAELYEHVDHAAPEAFAERALQLLNVEVNCSADDLALVPAVGPLIVASNHPHGAADGLLLATVLGRIRRDVRLLANLWLARIPELREICYFVDPFAGPSAAARSRAGLRAAHLWLRQGGAIVIFPAGEVAHRRRPDGSPIDSAWDDVVGRMSVKTGARILPAFINGGNSRLFYAAGRLHPALRTALLPRELLHKRGQRIELRFGHSLSARRLAEHGGDGVAATLRIREAMEELAQPERKTTHTIGRSEALSHEISRLPPRCRLLESGAFRVFVAEAREIPAALQQIGRLRAVAYQAVGEGTGRALDLDRFDEHYLHLFSWDSERRRIAGAYRIGRTDRILETQGLDGLYTRTLFRYDGRFVDRLSPALELGRSFVSAEYQRSYTALFLLWKGIGRFVTRHPEYRVLFGPVSISTRYSDSSHAMLRAFLEQNQLDRSLAELVDAINPIPSNRTPDSLVPVVPTTIDEADRLVSNLEADGRGMPVLLRQYLKLNARLIGFNVDPDFGDAVDALMMVDLAAVNPAILARYFGREDAARFLVRHRASRPSRAA